MSNSRIIRRPPARGTESKSSSSGKARWLIAGVLLLLLAACAWAFIPRTDPGLARLNELHAQLDAAPDGQRREIYGQIREHSETLWPETQERLRAERRNEGEARWQKEMNEFFELSPKERLAKLDESIDREERRRKEREQRRSQRASNGGNSGPRGSADAGGGRGGGRGGREGGPRGERDSIERRKRMLDRTTPTQRAQWSEYRRMRDERRQARGLPPSPWR